MNRYLFMDTSALMHAPNELKELINDGAILVLDRLEAGDLNKVKDLKYNNDEFGDIVEKTMSVRGQLVKTITEIYSQLRLMGDKNFSSQSIDETASYRVQKTVSCINSHILSISSLKTGVLSTTE